MVAASLLFGAKKAAEAGRRSLDAARNDATPETLLEPITTRRLADAHRDLTKARSRLRSPLVSPLRVLPYVGHQVRGSDAVVAAADRATTIATQSVADLHRLADRPHGAGPERVKLLGDLADLMARTRVALGSVQPAKPAGLTSSLAQANRDLDGERNDAVASLRRGEGATRSVAKVLDGPTPYLLLASNNAEMRAGRGMFLSAATVHFDHGRIKMSDVAATGTLALPPGSVPVGGELATNWPGTDPGDDLRHLGFTTDFPTDAAVARQTWAKVAGGGEVGGVISVDIDGLREMLRAIGPVTVGGTKYTYENVRGELLRKQYAQYDRNRKARREQLGEVAKAVFARFESGHWKLDRMGTAVMRATQARHLMVWSVDPATQAAWHTAGADGALGPETLSVALVNVGSDKLDSYVDTAGDLTWSHRPDGRWALTVEYRIHNQAPASGPAYIIGPNVPGLVAGEHKVTVVANMPKGSTDVTISAKAMTPAASGADGPTVMVAGNLVVPRGETAVVTVKAVLAKGQDRVIVQPSARIPHTDWKIDGQAKRVERPRPVLLN